MKGKTTNLGWVALGFLAGAALYVISKKFRQVPDEMATRPILKESKEPLPTYEIRPREKDEHRNLTPTAEKAAEKGNEYLH